MCRQKIIWILQKIEEIKNLQIEAPQSALDVFPSLKISFKYGESPDPNRRGVILQGSAILHETHGCTPEHKIQFSKHVESLDTCAISISSGHMLTWFFIGRAINEIVLLVVFEEDYGAPFSCDFITIDGDTFTKLSP